MYIFFSAQWEWFLSDKQIFYWIENSLFYWMLHIWHLEIYTQPGIYNFWLKWHPHHIKLPKWKLNIKIGFTKIQIFILLFKIEELKFSEEIYFSDIKIFAGWGTKQMNARASDCLGLGCLGLDESFFHWSKFAQSSFMFFIADIKICM